MFGLRSSVSCLHRRTSYDIVTRSNSALGQMSFYLRVTSRRLVARERSSCCTANRECRFKSAFKNCSVDLLPKKQRDPTQPLGRGLICCVFFGAASFPKQQIDAQDDHDSSCAGHTPTSLCRDHLYNDDTSPVVKLDLLFSDSSVRISSRFVSKYSFIFLCDCILRLKKKIFNRLTGTSELARITSKVGRRWQMFADIDFHLRKESQQDISLRVSSPDFDVQSVAIEIIKKEVVSPHSIAAAQVKVEDRLAEALEEMKRLNKIIHDARERTQVPFDPTNEEHETKLEQLWERLRGGVRREGGRISRDWGDIGFQGKDPATDFRGMGDYHVFVIVSQIVSGILGLDHLCYFAENHTETAQGILKVSNTMGSEFPFAVTGINLTKLILDLAEAGKLNYALFRSDLKLEEIYCQIFQQFARYYASQKPENVMGFHPIFQRFKTRLDVSLFARMI
ncbi:engulfment and cell motility ELM family protein [Planoprotostelium fungivorum]|uniref:Engulfment and cell motility ELM family protein n=1 Tax=Planoprotostelium fungivorum TaxID=1890364 RepID=A0A2P6NZF7_9EUKA|nr:engulfment and cell motility ELM family protein [Planoprotostelium fungivorum]